MEIQDFIEKFAEAIEVEDVEALTAETDFRELEEWSSLSVMLLIAFYDEEFGKEITEMDIRTAKNIGELYNIAVA